jgi:hypothetical protein
MINMPNKKNNFDAKEAACALLANKLYNDYVEVSSVICGVEVEHFAEDWIAKNLDESDKLMSRSIWRYFLKHLTEHSNGGCDGG